MKNKKKKNRYFLLGCVCGCDACSFFIIILFKLFFFFLFFILTPTAHLSSPSLLAPSAPSSRPSLPSLLSIMDALRASLASCLQLVKACLATRRGRRFLLAIPIVVGIFLILSTQIVDTIDLGRLSRSRGNNNLGSDPDRQTPPKAPTFDIDGNQVLEQNNRWRADTVAKEIEIPDSTWTCTDDGLSQTEKDTTKIKRSRQCVVKNLCVDRKGNKTTTAIHQPTQV